MIYVSTRNSAIRASAARAIVEGIAPDGGLFAPTSFPQIENLIHIDDMPYYMRVANVLKLWLDEFSLDELITICETAYNRFDDPAVAPVKKLSGGRHVLELWHGPTLAFKDMALQLMPGLLNASAGKVGEKRDILILVATSGDTGKAALEGFANHNGVRIAVFYPENGVSEAQKLQMVTQDGANVEVIAVRGNFDDTQTGVKRIFVDEEKINILDDMNMTLSSANSINLGRLLPQVAYYASAYADMAKAGDVEFGKSINVCVPTGNFGNILAAIYAKNIGVPIGKLICASNSNNVLSDFISSGVYSTKRQFHLTTSPSMDILISSNLERLLFELSGRDQGLVAGWMSDLKNFGEYRLDDNTAGKMRELLYGGWANEDEVIGEIRRTYESDGYVIDPHTAVGMKVAKDYRERTRDMRPMLITSTASPFKFGRTVLNAINPHGACPENELSCCDALSAITGIEVPEAISMLRTKPILHNSVCDVDGMWDMLIENLYQG